MKAFIITEAGKNIGFGHFMRMIAIYQAFETKNIKPKFIINGDESVEEYVKETEYEIFNWIDNQEKLFDMIKDADIAIIDSYLADVTLYEKISKLVKLPVYYDDNNRIEYPSGVVVNGNIHAKDLDYPKRDDITYLLGLEYLPLRKEFWEVPEKKIKDNVESIMITFGGDDFRNMTPKVLKLLAENYPNIKKNVIIGKGFKNIKDIEKASDENTVLIYFPDAQKMKVVMLGSDIAISAGGQTLYELARVGVPTIAVIVADNQIGNVTKWQELGFLENAGWWGESIIETNLINLLRNFHSYTLRYNASECAKRFIYGNGALKIINQLKSELGYFCK
ncbi:UDP-2,4-diacetamido-2,4,6-trideoxy-beta-L-altropyranose hydrolase [Deferribacteraceae bacterium V6Fe1]|nr:UDP-2,4-diacetamido-2,4,6-trideoxy-beta-L-altropyranose hydrolase [Deferribacteraceae bacterium V6Fe1]